MKTSHPQTPFWGRFRKREVCVYLAHSVVCPRVWAAEIGKIGPGRLCRSLDQRLRPQTARVIGLYPPEPQERGSGGRCLWPEQEPLTFLTRPSFPLPPWPSALRVGGNGNVSMGDTLCPAGRYMPPPLTWDLAQDALKNPHRVPRLSHDPRLPCVTSTFSWGSSDWWIPPLTRG